MTATNSQLILYFLVSEDVLQMKLEDVRNAKSQLKRRRVFALFNRNDRLPCHTYLVCELLLSHLVMVESKGSNVVADVTFNHFKLLSDRGRAAR